MLLRRAFHLVLAGAVLSSGLGKAQSRCPIDTRNSYLATQFHIGGPSIQMPIGAFLLVRKNGEIGAIRLTSIDSRATEDLGKFTYESFFPADHSGLFPSSSPKVIRQSGELEVKPEGGLIRGFAYQPGPHIAHIGKWSFSFVAPDMIWMAGTSFWKADHSYEFAPTFACDVSEIDAHDKRLRWFRYDPNASIVLPLADLPKRVVDRQLPSSMRRFVN